MISKGNTTLGTYLLTEGSFLHKEILIIQHKDMTHCNMMCRCAISPSIGVGAGEFKSIRFSPTGVAVGGMPALVEKGIGVGATLRRTGDLQDQWSV